MKNTQLFRVVPVNEIGVQAPTFFVRVEKVQVTNKITKRQAREKTISNAESMAREKSGLGRFKNWKFKLS